MVEWVNFLAALAPPKRVNHWVETARARVFLLLCITLMRVINLESSLGTIPGDTTWRLLSALSTPRRWRFFHDLLQWSVFLRKHPRLSRRQAIVIRLMRGSASWLWDWLNIQFNWFFLVRVFFTSSLVCTTWGKSQPGSSSCRVDT